MNLILVSNKKHYTCGSCFDECKPIAANYYNNSSQTVNTGDVYKFPKKSYANFIKYCDGEFTILVSGVYMIQVGIITSVQNIKTAVYVDENPKDSLTFNSSGVISGIVEIGKCSKITVVNLGDVVTTPNTGTGVVVTGIVINKL